MRYLCLLVVFAGLPATVAAQQNSPTLPSLGLPLPRIGLQPPWEKPQSPSWERPQTPAWERKNPPSWEPGHVSQRDLDEQRHRRRQQPTVVYIPYPVAIAQQQPIVVAQPASNIVSISQRQRAQIEEEIERIVEERIRIYRDSLPPPPAPEAPPPPPVEPGSRTLYLIPGCYMGNVSPMDMKLPAGCDLAKLVTITP